MKKIKLFCCPKTSFLVFFLQTSSVFLFLFLHCPFVICRKLAIFFPFDAIVISFLCSCSSWVLLTLRLKLTSYKHTDTDTHTHKQTVEILSRFWHQALLSLWPLQGFGGEGKWQKWQPHSCAKQFHYLPFFFLSFYFAFVLLCFERKNIQQQKQQHFLYSSTQACINS